MSTGEEPVVVDNESEEVEVDVVDETGLEAGDVAPDGVLDRVRGNRVIALAAGLLAASLIAAASVYWFVYRSDRLTDADAQQQIVSAAKEGTEAILSYSPQNLEADLNKAKSHLADPFLSYYSDFTAKTVVPAAKDKGVKTEANVARAAVSTIKPGRAEVLVFVNQVTTSKARPTPALATSSVMVTMVDKGGRWLISDFKPI